MKTRLAILSLWSAAVLAGEPAGLLSRQELRLPALTKDMPAYVELNTPMPSPHPAILVAEKTRKADDNPYPFRLVFSKIPGTGFDRIVFEVQASLAESLASDGKLVLVYRVGEDDKPAPEISEIIVGTPLRNYSQAVKVEASSDGQAWTPVGEGSLVDMSKFVDYRRDTLKLEKPVAARWFRLALQTPEASSELALSRVVAKFEKNEEVAREVVKESLKQPFRIDQVFFHVAELKPKPPQVNTYAESGAWTTAPDGDQTVLTVSGLGWRPVQQIEIETSSTNFCRFCTISCEGFETRRWARSEQLCHIDLGGIQERQVAVPFNFAEMPRCNRVGIHIQDRGAEPLKITGVRVTYVSQELQFIARPGIAYQLGFFDSAREIKEIDQLALLGRLPGRFDGDARFVKAELGPLVAFKPSPLNSIQGLRKWLPKLALLLAVLSLGWTLFRTSRHLDAGGPGPAA